MKQELKRNSENFPVGIGSSCLSRAARMPALQHLVMLRRSRRPRLRRRSRWRHGHHDFTFTIHVMTCHEWSWTSWMHMNATSFCQVQYVRYMSWIRFINLDLSSRLRPRKPAVLDGNPCSPCSPYFDVFQNSRLRRSTWELLKHSKHSKHSELILERSGKSWDRTFQSRSPSF